MRIAANDLPSPTRPPPPTRLARELEQRGFSGLYLPEHTHIPVERTTPYPAGGDLPREYGRTLDPFVALGQAAAVTERLGLGTGITLVAQHDPIALAKQIATLDHLSGGRFTLGLGYGWNVEEAADHGVSWRTRRDLVRDRVRLMQALWSEKPTAYEGEFGSVRASLAHPQARAGAARPGRRPPHPRRRGRRTETVRAHRRVRRRLAAHRRARAHRVAARAALGVGGRRPRPGRPPDRPVRRPAHPRQARPLRRTGHRGGRGAAAARRGRRRCCARSTPAPPLVTGGTPQP
ncbi:TIGR03619 family F420-dependent LLM class oxidoreductase [Streptomyces tricolor]|nr:TIGR03619 family F420-dependent LLM class oxidoreductase [Streptomyces tricolor]